MSATHVEPTVEPTAEPLTDAPTVLPLTCPTCYGPLDDSTYGFFRCPGCAAAAAELPPEHAEVFRRPRAAQACPNDLYLSAVRGLLTVLASMADRHLEHLELNPSGCGCKGCRGSYRDLLCRDLRGIAATSEIMADALNLDGGLIGDGDPGTDSYGDDLRVLAGVLDVADRLADAEAEAAGAREACADEPTATVGR